jgi:hypothetical protein
VPTIRALVQILLLRPEIVPIGTGAGTSNEDRSLLRREAREGPRPLVPMQWVSRGARAGLALACLSTLARPYSNLESTPGTPGTDVRVFSSPGVLRVKRGLLCTRVSPTGSTGGKMTFMGSRVPFDGTPPEH